MVAYILPADTNGAAIQDGRRYALVAAPRPAESRNAHAHPSARIHLSSAHSAERPRRYFRAGRCVLSAQVSLSADGVVRILYAETPRPTDAHAALGEGLANHLRNAEQGSPRDRQASADAVAQACGFDDYAALWENVRRHDGDKVVRQIIAWGPPGPAEGAA